MSHKPRIAWFTPLSHKSAIGRFSRIVARALAPYADVHLWVPQDSDFELAEGRVISLSDYPELAKTRMGEYDLAIYNMGDHYPNHGQIYRHLHEYPGLVILHDVVLHDFFHYLFFHNKDDRAGYLNLIDTAYGPAIRNEAELALDGEGLPLWDATKVSRFPLFEPAIAVSSGVIVHSEWAKTIVQERYAGPVEKLFLAYDVPGPDEPKASVPRPDRRLLMLSMGHVNPNRRIQCVLETLGENPDIASAVEYVIAGDVEEAHLQGYRTTVEKYKLESSVRFTGYTEDHSLRALLEAADLCVNLRYPAMESGSASLAEQMLAGKAVIVSDTGCYQDVPGDCVLKVDPLREREELSAALRSILSDATLRRTLGRNAQAFARKNFSAQEYAARLFPVIENALSLKPLTLSLDHIGANLRSIGATPDMAIYRTVSDTFHELFCSGPSRFSSQPGAASETGRIFFLHIPKTAGMSLREIVSSQYGPGEMLEVYQGELDFWPPNDAVLAALQNPQSRLKAVYGHFAYGVHILSGDESARYVTMMRNPVSRIVSFYRHQARERGSRLYRFIAEGQTLRDLVENHMAPEFNNYVTRTLATDTDLIRNHLGSEPSADEMKKRLGDLRGSLHYLAGLDDSGGPCDQIYHRRHLETALCHIEESFLFVGITERFEESMKLLSEGLGWKSERREAPHINQSPSGPLRVDDATLDAIRAHNGLDFELYERFEGLSFANFRGR